MFEFRAVFRPRLFRGMLLVGVVMIAAATLVIPNFYERAAWKLQQWAAAARRFTAAQPDALPTPSLASTAAPALAAPATEIPPPQDPAAVAPASLGLPRRVELTGFVQVWQKVNNCGPATLAMGLAYWGWTGTQANTAAALKPNPEDKNVSPEEMAAYAREVGLGALVRPGGDAVRLKQFLALGLPVIVEKGLVLPDAGWEGHYVLVSGYSDDTQNFTTQDSLQGPNMQAPYDWLLKNWRAFNYTYLVLYPPARQSEVEAVLGPETDEAESYRRAAAAARAEIPRLQGQPLAFAWFNLGTSLLRAGDASAAAEAYDEARLNRLPFRMLWYQTGPWEAYFAVGRYADVRILADATLDSAPNIEEALYWRGRARLAQGDFPGAAADWRKALEYNPRYAAPRQALAELGLTP